MPYGISGPAGAYCDIAQQSGPNQAVIDCPPSQWINWPNLIRTMIKPTTIEEIDQAIEELEEQREALTPRKDNRDPRLAWDGILDATGAKLAIRNCLSNDHLLLSVEEAGSVKALFCITSIQLRELAEFASGAALALEEWEENYV